LKAPFLHDGVLDQLLKFPWPKLGLLLPVTGILYNQCSIYSIYQAENNKLIRLTSKLGPVPK